MRNLRDLFQRLPNDGKMRDALRLFNLSPHQKGGAVSVRELAEKLGLGIWQLDLPAQMGGRLVADAFSESGYSIQVNQNHSVQSRRFTVLHEIGHYLLHVPRNKRQSDPLFEGLNLHRGDEEIYFDTLQEREANAVVDVLLFGDGALEAALSLFNNDISRTAHFFGVTVKMVEIAKRKFGM